MVSFKISHQRLNSSGLNECIAVQKKEISSRSLAHRLVIGRAEAEVSFVDNNPGLRKRPIYRIDRRIFRRVIDYDDFMQKAIRLRIDCVQTSQCQLLAY